MGDTPHPSAAAVISLYRRHAAAWDAARAGSFPDRARVARFAALLPTGGTVLDIGCGAGAPIALSLEDAGLKVAGIDTAPPLLALARARLPDHEFLEADMRRLSLGRRFDGLIAWDSFFHLGRDDQRAMFPVFAAHAAPGAVLMFTSGTEDGEAIGSFEGEPLHHASLASADYRGLLAASGFAVLDHVENDPGCGHHTIWLARRV